MKSISEEIFEALKQPDTASIERAMHKIVIDNAGGYNDTMRPFVDHHKKVESSLRPVPTNPATLQALYDIYMENMIAEGKYHETLDFDAWQNKRQHQNFQVATSTTPLREILDSALAEERNKIKRLDVDMLPDFGKPKEDEGHTYAMGMACGRVE